jgi:hypothetical protein
MQTQTQYGWVGIGLILDYRYFAPPAFPVVARARGNRFVGNDAGVVIRSGPQMPAGAPAGIDFGTASDPGDNTFSCNSTAAVLGSLAGGDVLLEGEAPQQPPVTLAFEGNVWDHVPPQVFASSDPNAGPAGMDVFVYKSGSSSSSPYGPQMDAAGATATSTACPSGRVP